MILKQPQERLPTLPLIPELQGTGAVAQLSSRLKSASTPRLKLSISFRLRAHEGPSHELGRQSSIFAEMLVAGGGAT